MLQILILSKNFLKSLEKHFQFPQSLIILNLSFSIAIEFPKHFLNNLNELEILDFSNSKIGRYHPNIFSGLDKLKYLNIQNISFVNSSHEFSLRNFEHFKNLNLLKCDKKKYCCFMKFY